MTSQHAHAAAQAAVAREIGPHLADRETAMDVAGEVLALLTRTGWRHVPQLAQHGQERRVAAPPPSEWADVRREVHQAAERDRAALEAQP